MHNPNIPKYIMHNAIVKHHLFKHNYTDIPTLNDNWYYDINLHKIVIEGVK